ncbi:coagulation factor XIII B chain [Astyanax mexicanus]|uniref:coagulation factor XIII B chain n=1 Tax=Astyanax mexicanus TaxID=7994 RepID=UPI0020CB1BF7|nr:coagulation factor XIII B chain [Astyanax mexicanus]
MRIIVLALCVWLCQASGESCKRPKISGGFVVPVSETYSHATKLSYSCNREMKTTLETWWGELLCDNGKWSPVPLCVPITNCIPQNIKNAQPMPPRASYSDSSNVTFVCKRGFKADGQIDMMVTCNKGAWIRHAECKRDASACNPPAKVNNAMITRPYQDTFEHGDTVEFVCQNGFRLEGNKSSTCLNGTWSSPPIQCVKVMVQTQPEGSANSRKPTYDESGVTQGGSEDSSDPSRPAITHVRECKPYPTIENGDFIEESGGRALKAECASFYKLEGPKQVMCVLGQWSKLPVCKAPCLLDQSQLLRSQRRYLIHGEEDEFWCKWGGWVKVKCVDGRAQYEGCKCIIHTVFHLLKNTL